MAYGSVQTMRYCILAFLILCGANTFPTSAQTVTTLSQARNYLAATSVGNLALFGGGSGSNRVDIFDASSNTWRTATLSQARSGLAAASAGNLALFAGGFNV